MAARRGSLLAFSQRATLQFHAALEADSRSETRRLSTKQKAKNGSTSRWKGFLILSEVQSDDPISEACVHRGDGIRWPWQEVADCREEGRLRSSQPWGRGGRGIGTCFTWMCLNCSPSVWSVASPLESYSCRSSALTALILVGSIQERKSTCLQSGANPPPL